MSWKCRIGFHDWREDSSVEFRTVNAYTFQLLKYPERTCERCQKYQYKGVYIIPSDGDPVALVERSWS